MLQLVNDSPFVPALAVLPNPDAVDTLYIVVKATFTLHPRVAVAAKPAPPSLVDEYWGDPVASSIKYASELHVGKRGTDVVLVGQAWAPGGRRAVPESAAMVSVAERQKMVRVSGDRVWKSPSSFSDPEPFVSMPLVFERAFGGSHHEPETGRLFAEERNPVGVGFVGRRSRKELVGQKVPNVEDPRDLMQNLGDRRTPAGFGFVAPGWLPRRQFGGTYDEAWQKQRAPYLPADFDRSFFNAAVPELTFDRWLAGGEPVALVGVSPHGPLRLSLPRCRPTGVVRVAGAEEAPPFRLETVLIEPDENRVCLSWRAELPCDKKALKIETVTIGVKDLDVPLADVTPG